MGSNICNKKCFLDTGIMIQLLCILIDKVICQISRWMPITWEIQLCHQLRKDRPTKNI